MVLLEKMQKLAEHYWTLYYNFRRPKDFMKYNSIKSLILMNYRKETDIF